MTTKDFLSAQQRSQIGELPLRHSYALKYTGVARPGKTAKKRAKELARKLQAAEAQKTA